MVVIIKSKISPDAYKSVTEDFDGYLKVVVDVRRRLLAAGGKKHVDAEQALLQDGSRQEDLWGAGLDLATNEMDFDSLINIRPTQNASREVLDRELRQDIEEITRFLLEK
jgi:hypothetical protein